jgi:hypothetical protein
LRKRQWSVYRLSKESGVAMKTTQKIVAGQSPESSFWSIVDLACALEVSLEALAGTPTAPERVDDDAVSQECASPTEEGREVEML